VIRKELRVSIGGASSKVSVHTVDSFQGSEASVVILSLVRSNSSNTIGFLSDSRRLNVAITRAKDMLIIVGDGHNFKQQNSSKASNRDKNDEGNVVTSLYQDSLERGFVKSRANIRDATTKFRDKL
jgi:superfamily I DNA and/or RNA helicase